MPRFPSPPPKPWTERRIRGITLAQYAAVHAGVSEGWPLDDVLAAEGVPAKVWARADDAWSDALLDTEDEAAEDAHDALFLAAQDRYGRPIPPIDRDLGAWLDLIRAFSADLEPLAFLGRVGLRTNDLLRLHRAWSTRLSEEPLLREEALARMADPTGPVPVITPEPACSALSASAHLADAFADEDSIDDDELDEEPPDEAPPPPLFAAMPSGSESIEPTTAEIDAVAPSLTNAAVSQIPPVPRAPAHTPVPPRPAPSAGRLNETSAFSLAEFVAPRQALPFVAAPATPKEPTAEVVGTVAPRAPARPAPSAGRLNETSAFSLAEFVAPGSALPFVISSEPSAPSANQATPVASSPPPGAEDVTQIPQPSPLRPALPFQPERDPTAALPLDRYAALCVALGESKEDAEVVFARFGLASLQERLTVDRAWRERLRREPGLYAQFNALYAQHRAAPPVPVGASSGAEDVTQIPLPSPLRPALPFQPERDPTAALPLDRYAALCVALGESKEDAEVVFARFGLASLQERLTVDCAWRERLRREPGLHAQFNALYAQHRAAPPVPVGASSGAEDVTQIPQPSPLRPALPFQPERDPTAALPLDRYAALCAALGESKEDAEVVFVRFGLASLQERLAVDLAWRERLRREPGLYAQFNALYAQHRDALHRGDGHPSPER